jgi:uncharacterized protein YwgA
MKEGFRWLAGAIAAHKDRKVVGRTRLQKEIKLLQRLGFPTEYSYTLFFYGPYSEGLQADIGFLQAFGLVTEEERLSHQGDTYFVLKASADADMPPEMAPYRRYIDLMQEADAVVLELAATYDMFRTMKSDHDDAMMRLRRKKGDKCDNGNDNKALDLLHGLGLLSS